MSPPFLATASRIRSGLGVVFLLTQALPLIGSRPGKRKRDVAHCYPLLLHRGLNDRHRAGDRNGDQAVSPAESSTTRTAVRLLLRYVLNKLWPAPRRRRSGLEGSGCSSAGRLDEAAPAPPPRSRKSPPIAWSIRHRALDERNYLVRALALRVRDQHRFPEAVEQPGERTVKPVPADGHRRVGETPDELIHPDVPRGPHDVATECCSGRWTLRVCTGSDPPGSRVSQTLGRWLRRSGRPRLRMRFLVS